MQNWSEIRENTMRNGKDLFTSNTDVIEAYRALNDATKRTGSLGSKIHELVALAVAVTTRCEGCIASHAKAAKAAGATEDEVAEVLGVAIALNAGAAYVYSGRALNAFRSLDE